MLVLTVAQGRLTQLTMVSGVKTPEVMVNIALACSG